MWKSEVKQCWAADTSVVDELQDAARIRERGERCRQEIQSVVDQLQGAGRVREKGDGRRTRNEASSPNLAQTSTHDFAACFDWYYRTV